MAKKKQKKGGFKGVIDGSLLAAESVTKQVPFVLFLTFWAILYIANRYAAEKLVRNTKLLETEIKELRSEAIATASELMYRSKRSEVAKEIEKRGMGLIAPETPPYILKLNEDE